MYSSLPSAIYIVMFLFPSKVEHVIQCIHGIHRSTKLINLTEEYGDCYGIESGVAISVLSIKSA